MTFLKQFNIGFSTWSKSWSFIRKNGLSHFFIYPILVSVTLFFGTTRIIKMMIETLMTWVNEYFGVIEGDAFDSFTNFFAQLGTSIIEISAWALSLIVFWKISKYVTLALMSPVMSLLASRAQEKINGETIPFNFHDFISDIGRGVALSFRNLFAELGMNLLLFLINVIVGFVFAPLDLILSPLSWVISLLISAYYSGFSTMDYAMENKRYSYSKSVKFIRKNSGLAVGNGLPYALLFRIPFFGPSLVIVTCTVAGVLILNNTEAHNKID
ncbi:MAG: EI24 domain-containing protein [Flavobacteriales bacterium]